VTAGRIPFFGPTFHGELRELCGIRISNDIEYWHFGNNTLPECLPAYLHGHGYETTALHGYTGAFYERYDWYPALGFDSVLFDEELSHRGVTALCGSSLFRGLCDASVLDYMKTILAKGTDDKPQFVYWMTLNTHLPADESVAADSKLDCGRYNTTRKFSEVCTHTRALYKVLSKIVEAASDPSVFPARFIIVGDHGPPFMNSQIFPFFDMGNVPFIQLEPVSHVPISK
jgi:phosphoglycerol transferase MdoB-like AlkP superfamily enzyme